MSKINPRKNQVYLLYLSNIYCTETAMCHHTGIKPFYETDPVLFSFANPSSMPRERTSLCHPPYSPLRFRRQRNKFMQQGAKPTKQPPSKERWLHSAAEKEGGREGDAKVKAWCWSGFDLVFRLCMQVASLKVIGIWILKSFFKSFPAKPPL